MRSVFWWNLPSHYSTHIRPPVNPLPSSAHLIIRFVKGNLELYCIVLVFFFPKHVAGHRMIGLTIPHDCTADSWWWWTSRHLSVVESSWSLLLMEDGNKMAVSVMLRMRLKRHLNIESFYQHLKKKKKMNKNSEAWNNLRRLDFGWGRPPSATEHRRLIFDSFS